MDTIFIPQLAKAPERTEVQQFKEFLSDLETLTPVQGVLKVTHQGNYLEVLGQAETIITLACDRCLQHYNYRLSFDVSELIWLEDEPNPVELPQEQEVSTEDLIETLSPQGYFHPQEWVYQQLCLATPYRALCDATCQGIPTTNNGSQEPMVDQRWAKLAALKQQSSK
jgi:uncharacterized protein